MGNNDVSADQTITRIQLTDQERIEQTITPQHLQEARQAMEQDGLVVLQNAVDLEHVQILRDRMLQDLEAFQNRPDTPYNWTKGNIQQDPPPLHPYLFADILLNGPAIQITHAILGNGLKNAFYSGNTALPIQDRDPAKERQPVHADIGHLWPNMKHPTPPYGIVVNLPLVPTSPHNGATELWPRTHQDTSISISDGFIEVTPQQLARFKPVQPELPLGSLLIRDIRLWHAGMPNFSDQARPMVAMIHYASWFAVGEPLKFPKGTEEFFKHPLLHTHATFVDPDQIDYINANAGYKPPTP